MLFSDSYNTLSGFSEGQFRDRGSRFIGLAWPVKTEEDVKKILNKVKKDHPQAAHHCYAFRLSPDTSIFRFSDDREPAGTAGRPILNAILSAGLTDLLIIVVRYFGGTLLGVPGLINAYREAATLAIKNATVIEKVIYEKFLLQCPYEQLNEAYQFIKNIKAKITDQEIAESCTLKFEIRKSEAIETENKFRLLALSASATLKPDLNK